MNGQNAQPARMPTTASQNVHHVEIPIKSIQNASSAKILIMSTQNAHTVSTHCMLILSALSVKLLGMLILSVISAKMDSTTIPTLKIIAHHATVIRLALLTIFVRRRQVSVNAKWGLEAQGNVTFVNLVQANTQIVEVNQL